MGNVSFRMPDNLLAHVATRMGKEVPKRTDVIRRDLARYYDCIDITASDIDISKKEFLFLSDVCNSNFVSTISVHLFYAVADFAIKNYQLDKKWDIIPDVIISKLKSYTHFHTMCILDTVERYLNTDDIYLTDDFSFFDLVNILNSLEK